VQCIGIFLRHLLHLLLGLNEFVFFLLLVLLLKPYMFNDLFVHFFVPSVSIVSSLAPFSRTSRCFRVSFNFLFYDLIALMILFIGLYLHHRTLHFYKYLAFYRL